MDKIQTRRRLTVRRVFFLDLRLPAIGDGGGTGTGAGADENIPLTALFADWNFCESQTIYSTHLFFYELRAAPRMGAYCLR